MKSFAILLGLLLASALSLGTPVARQGSCAGCNLLDPAGLSGGQAGDFEACWEDNPNPGQGEAHGDGKCRLSGSSCFEDKKCTVNGTLTVTNNSDTDVLVNWEGQSGGTPVASGGGMNSFASGVVRMNCGSGSTSSTKSIEIKTEQGQTLALWTFSCTKCVWVAPPDH